MAEQTERYEWKDLSPDLAIRQGDLLVARNTRTKKVLKMAVVITADCDIDKSKHGPQIACLNIRFHDEYIRTTWAESNLASSRRSALKPATAKLMSHLVRQEINASELSPKAVEDWLIRDDLSKIAERLKIEKHELAAFEGALRGVQSALRKDRSKINTTCFERLHCFHAELVGKTPEAAKAEILKKAQGATLPSDVFFLPGFPTNLERSVLVMLREMIGIDTALVTTRQSEVLSDANFLRVGRLRSTFKFALSQQFASLYSKIGLPGAYESRAKSALERTRSYE